MADLEYVEVSFKMQENVDEHICIICWFAGITLQYFGFPLLVDNNKSLICPVLWFAVYVRWGRLRDLEKLGLADFLPCEWRQVAGTVDIQVFIALQAIIVASSAVLEGAVTFMLTPLCVEDEAHVTHSKVISMSTMAPNLGLCPGILLLESPCKHRSC